MWQKERDNRAHLSTSLCCIRISNNIAIAERRRRSDILRHCHHRRRIRPDTAAVTAKDRTDGRRVGRVPSLGPILKNIVPPWGIHSGAEEKRPDFKFGQDKRFV